MRSLESTGSLRELTYSWEQRGGSRSFRFCGRLRENGEVAERSNATDCKSVALAASEVRILPSPPRVSGPLAEGNDGFGGSGVSGIRGSNSVVESQPSKLLVAGSIPVSRSIFGDVSQTSLVTSVWRLICR